MQGGWGCSKLVSVQSVPSSKTEKRNICGDERGDLASTQNQAKVLDLQKSVLREKYKIPSLLEEHQ